MTESVRLEHRDLSPEEFKELIREGSIWEFLLPEQVVLGQGHPDAIGNMMSHLCHYAMVASAIKPTDDILDVGCGCGLAVKFYRLKTEGRVVAVDRPPAIEIARCAYYTPGVEYYAGDFADHSLPEGPFDLATMIDVYEHLPEDVGWRILDELSARLRPDGRFLISVPLMSRGGYAKNNAYHLREFADEPTVLQEVATHLAQGQSVRFVTTKYLSDPVRGTRVA